MKGHISRWLAVVLVLLGASSYGLLSPFIKKAYAAGWDVVQVTVSQVTVGTALLWVFVLITPKAWSNPFREPWIRLSLVGIFGLSLTTIFLNTSLAELDASLAIVLLFQFTWITILADSVSRRTWPKPYQWLAVLLVIVGTALSVRLGDVRLAEAGWKGIAFGLLSAVTYSIFLFYTGKIKTSLHFVLKSAIMQTAALPVMFILYPPQYLVQPAAGGLLLWGLLLGMLGQVFPTVFFNIGIPRIGSSLAAMLASVELPVAVVGAFVLLGEKVLMSQWIGMALILAGIVVSELKGRTDAGGESGALPDGAGR